MNKTQTAYTIPGLGANSKIYERIDWPKNWKVTHLEWQVPESEDQSLEDYITNFSKQIKADKPIIIGTSFGGILAQEIAEMVQASHCYILSSISAHDQLSPAMKLVRETKAYKVFPVKYLNQIEAVFQKIPNDKLQKRLKFYPYYLDQRDPVYIRWGIRQVLHWKGLKKRSVPLTHLHGRQDQVFPIKHIKGAQVIDNCDHAMVLTKAQRISKILNS
jgi:pimeloyl-ACP methyl ester carboxylesterase